SDSSSVLADQHIFSSARLQYGLTPARDYEAKSQNNFQELCKKIDQSIQDEALIYLEDGEPDDHLQSGLGVMEKRAPGLLLLRGGFDRLRFQATELVWKQYSTKFPIKKPKIMTIHGDRTEETMATFDFAEGSGFAEAERKELMRRSLADETSYLKEVAQAEESLREILNKKSFTTIVVKAAPTGLAKIIRDIPNFKEKIAIVWTEPVGVRKEGGFGQMFNFYQDVQASKELLELKVPIIVACPRIGNAEMSVGVDKELMGLYRQHGGYKGKFEGFDNLNRIKSSNGVISKFIDAAAQKFQGLMIDRWGKRLADLDAEEKTFREDNAAMPSSEDLTQKLQEFAFKRQQLQESLGAKWDAITQNVPKEKNFREFCVVDPFAETILSETLRQDAVEQVIQTNLEMIGSGKNMIFFPRIGAQEPEGNVFFITKVNSDGLKLRVQTIVNWLAGGEGEIVV
ncbi:hypothetical protein O181_069017, partial [Austropuccinia psidii MF-1]|nr:hypothetical protein [Austropuccinia psidii MF-1]